MSLYRVDIEGWMDNDTLYKWKNFKGANSFRMAYSLNLTKRGVRKHRSTPVEEDGYLVVTPFYEYYSYYDGYYSLGHDKKEWCCYNFM